MPERDHLISLDKNTLVDLLEDAAKNWLAHDGLWFQAIEKEFGMDAALEMDRQAWKVFTQVEAKRIMRRLGIEPGGGIEALEQALRYRLYAWINEQEIYRVDERTLRFEMKECRVQSARERKGLPDFPCKSVGIVEYAYFAYTIDPRLKTEVIFCPPDLRPEGCYCTWQFSLQDEPIPADAILSEGSVYG
ncbi:MAG: hypothetical protein GWN14_06130 [candidate division Zixibacteria bacterium]|nr:hypothetical protein [Gammaproteobacteria bacterium]NIX55505.1 hypothetical protein [candidate division Zixibacteria bacterium]